MRPPRTARTRHRLSRGSRAALRTAVAFAVAFSGTALDLAQTNPAAGQSASTGTIREVGTIALQEKAANGSEEGALKKDGFLILDSEARVGYQVFTKGTQDDFVDGPARWNASRHPTRVYSFNLDTLQPIARREFTNFRAAPVGHRLAPGDLAHAVDPQGGRVFIAGLYAPVTVPVLSEKAPPGDPTVAVIDERKFNDLTIPDTATDSEVVTYLPAPPVQAAQLSRTNAFGMTYWEENGRGKLNILYSVDARPWDAPLPHAHYLVQWDATTGAAEWGGVPYRVTACEQAPLTPANGEDWKYQVAILRTPDAVYLPCQVRNEIGQVVKVRLQGGAPASEQGFPIPRLMTNSLVDPRGGRLFVETVFRGATWFTFDAQRDAWVGAAGVAASDKGVRFTSGVDPTTGRMYTLSVDHAEGETDLAPGGLLIGDMRLPNPPQFRNVWPEFNYPGQFLIVVDPAADGRPTRLFVRRGNVNYETVAVPGSTEPRPTPSENFWRVLEDTIPISVQPPPDDPDAGTTQVAPAAGVTAERFDSTASGFGFRARLVGGTRAFGQSPPVGFGCASADRELTFAGVRAAQLSNLVASATSASLDADPTTRLDLERPSSRCWPSGFGAPPDVAVATVDAVAGERWNETALESECVGDAEPPASELAENLQTYRASTRCRQATGEVSADASAAIAPAPNSPVKVASSDTVTTLRRDPERGVVVRVEAFARGIEIDGVGSIAEVRTVAESWAGGVAGSAGTTFTRLICGVQFVNFQRAECAEAGPVVTAINGLLGRNGKARLQQPDPILAAGSPGGYLAGIQRDRQQRFEDETLSRDTSHAVPGLELIFTHGDNKEQGAGRQIFQFAAVEATTAFGISCLLGESETGEGCAELLAVTGAPAAPNRAAADQAGAAELTLTDDATKALAGATFDVIADATQRSAGSCTTGVDGTCRIDGLPLGAYTAKETQPPRGFQAADPVPFKIERAGQVVRLTFVNVRTAANAPVVAGAFENAASTSPPSVSGADRFLQPLLDVPRDVLKLIFSHPGEAALMAAVWLLLYLPSYLADRRRLLADLSLPASTPMHTGGSS